MKDINIIHKQQKNKMDIKEKTLQEEIDLFFEEFTNDSIGGQHDKENIKIQKYSSQRMGTR